MKDEGNPLLQLIFTFPTVFSEISLHFYNKVSCNREEYVQYDYLVAKKQITVSL